MYAQRAHGPARERTPSVVRISAPAARWLNVQIGGLLDTQTGDSPGLNAAPQAGDAPLEATIDLSVAIVSFNDGEWLERCLASLVNTAATSQLR